MALPIVPIALFGLGAYAADVVARPERIALAARRAARRRGKLFLNVGAGTPGSSARVAVFGPTSWGDVNTDLAGEPLPARGGPLRRDVVYQADVQRLPFRDKQFGAVIASHVLEHVDDPVSAQRELDRVADEVFIITPPGWAPHTWLHPGHQWFRTPNGRWLSLHRRRRAV